MVLAGDLGPAETKWQGADPALVGEASPERFTPEGNAAFRTRGLVMPGDLTFVPFYRQYGRLSAVYFKQMSQGEWHAAQAAFAAEQARLKDLDARSVDATRLGDIPAERDHNLTFARSYSVSYRGRSGRDARSGGFFEFDMKGGPGALILLATYCGDERARDFDILVDNVLLATQRLDADRPGLFFDVQYAIPQALTRAQRVRVRTADGGTAGPVFASSGRYSRLG
jgi:hypothetical protein